MTELPITQVDSPPGFIDLGNGNPDLGLLPLVFVRQAAEKFFASNDPRPLQYGTEQGNGFFRHALAGFLSKAYRDQVDPDQMFVTSGVSSALDLICTLFTKSGDVIFAEEPSYFLALSIFADHGLKVVPIPMDKDGLHVDVLEELLQEHSPKFIYTIPTFQNPSGLTISLERRQKLIEIAQEEKIMIVADEVYHFLNYGDRPPEPFSVLGKGNENVISISSFSKILAPGLRLGWIQAHRSIIQRLAGCGLLDSGGGMNPFTSAIVRHLIEAGNLESHLRRIRAEYACRLGAMVYALQEYLPQANFVQPSGGFFYWVEFPGAEMSQLRQKLNENMVDVRPGALFSCTGDMQAYARLSICHYRGPEIEEGVQRLGACF